MSLLVQLASYNTNLQGDQGVPQDLVDWLSPTLQVSSFLAHQKRPADIIAVGFQELLPLHLGLSGLATRVLETRTAHILAQLETHGKERYVLVARIVHGGVALLVYARDAGVGRMACDVQTSWTGTGPAYMANKGAVAVRFRVPGDHGAVGETFTFVCAHLTAHAPRLAQRIADWRHIVSTLLFDGGKTTLYDTSHLFVLGDLNSRIVLPPEHPLLAGNAQSAAAIAETLDTVDGRVQLKEFDQLLRARHHPDPAQRAFIGLREGEFWRFKCSYKYHLGEVDLYSMKRAPSWTDRILYATYTDSPDAPEESNIVNLLYTSVPGYTTSDHKPIVALLLLPAPPSASSPSASTTSLTPSNTSTTAPLLVQATTPPTLRLPPSYAPTPDPYATLKRHVGRVLDRLIGRTWWLLTLLGAGSAVVGAFNFVLSVGLCSWWRSRGAEGGGAITV